MENLINNANLININVMFGKGKTATKVLEHNSILNQYDVGRLFGSGGPEGVWKIYEGMNKTDGRVSFVYWMVNL